MHWLKENIEIIIGMVIIAIIIILLVIFGCEETYTKQECYDNVLPADMNMAMGISVVETARTEAATEAKIKLMSAIIEKSCSVAAIACVAVFLIGLYLRSKLIVISSIGGLITFTVGAFWMAARTQHPKIIAGVGLGIMGLVLASLVFIVILNRKALVQVIKGNEKFKEASLGVETFKTAQIEAQSKTTEKIVSSIRNGGSK